MLYSTVLANGWLSLKECHGNKFNFRGTKVADQLPNWVMHMTGSITSFQISINRNKHTQALMAFFGNYELEFGD